MWKEVSKHSEVAPAAALPLVAASMAVLMIGGVYLMVGHVCAVEPTPTREGVQMEAPLHLVVDKQVVAVLQLVLHQIFAAAFVHASRTALAVESDEVEREVPFACHLGQYLPFALQLSLEHSEELLRLERSSVLQEVDPLATEVLFSVTYFLSHELGAYPVPLRLQRGDHVLVVAFPVHLSVASPFLPVDM